MLESKKKLRTSGAYWQFEEEFQIEAQSSGGYMGWER
jgi:hypothetical protein